MSDWLTRWPARLATSAAIAVAFATCARPHAPVARGGKAPDLRIGLVVAAPGATVSGEAEVAAVAGGEPVFRLLPGQQVTLRPEGLALNVSGGPARGRYESLSFVSLTPGRFLLVNGRPYRGVADAYIRNAALYVVNRLSVEEYLRGVVSAEMGRRAPNEIQALESQAVVSRTYALGNRGRYASSGFDIGTDISDQAYGGVTAETEQGNDAVRNTQGIVLTYGGKLIRAFFHSTCGYATAAPEEAFRQITSTPYLRSVSDRKPRGGYYCEISPRFRWRVEWDADTLARILRRTAPAQPGIERERIDRVRDIRVTRTGPSGRVMEVRVRVSAGELILLSPDIRTILRTPSGDPLGSTAFQLHTRTGPEGLVITAAGAGWGHGVGFCQWGAVGRARAGQDYRTIVRTYFPGAEVTRWY
ncbi:MAG: SpoIID/LytB domain-containing protein [Gemmatimonadetes bacterium]|nr:SpoIID/LytB domain-containing protein [Gemmatimonadota bacterium]